MPPSLLPLTSHSVAVIGAGPAGLVAARELRREGHKVVVFERSDQIGGTWVYTSQTEPDPLSLDPNRPIINTSLFESLRTNLPRESMGFKDFPFVAKEGKFRDPRRFPGHREVLEYLKEFAREFGIEEVVRFESEVVNVGLVEGDNKKWRVKYKVKGSDVSDEVFDAVVVCVGHYTEPRIAEIPGISSWPGKQIHSHNYRIPEPFTDQVIVLIGSATSSDDMSREIAKVAKEVHIVSRSVAADTYEKLPGYENMWLHSMIEGAHEDGTVAFLNERRVVADVIIHCTGYKFHFPFLQIGDIVTVDDNRVGPLYKHVFPPALAPSLSFVGVPWKVLLFPLFEIQSKWIAGTLSGRIQLPSKEEMMEDVRAFYLNLEASNTPKRYTHKMDYSYVDYGNWLAVQCGCPSIEEWRRQLFIDALQRNLMWPDSYRDEWVDEQLIAEAHKDFSGYTSKVIPEA